MSPDVLERNESSEALSGRQWQPPRSRSPRGRRQDFHSGITSAAGLEAIRFGAHALVFEQPVPSWCYPLLEQISELGELPSGWDSYGARPIDADCAVAAAELVLNLLGHNSPKPAIVPTTRGGIQLEWHRAGADLEIEVISPTKMHIVFEDDRTGEQREFSLSANCLPLLPLLHRVTQAD